MARTEMATLITRVRGHINDPAGIDQLFNDDEIEAVLDLWRLEVKQEALRCIATRTAAGDVYLDFESEYADFETGATLQDKDWVAIDSGDYVVSDAAGKWAFPTQPNYPVYLTGHAYDHYGAAADLMDQKVAKMADMFDWSADGGSYKQSQLYTQLNGVAGYLRQRQKGYGFHFKGTGGEMIRTDVPEYYS